MSTMKINDKYELVTEVYGANGEQEITVYIREISTKIICQDICLVRPKHYDNRDTVECLVWDDEFQEDYTRRFEINIYDNWENEE